MLSANAARELLFNTSYDVKQELNEIEIMICNAIKYKVGKIVINHLHDDNKKCLKELGYDIMTRYSHENNEKKVIDYTISW